MKRVEASSDISRHWPNAAILFIMVMVLIGIMLVSITIGRYPIPLGVLPRMVLERLFSDWYAIHGQPNNTQMMAIFFNVRLPRIAMASLVGACLSAAGASYQGVFQNPMAAPDILGASSGAAMGAAFAILLELPGYMVMAFAFTASLLTIALVMLVSKYAWGKRVLGLVIAGIMISSLCNSATSFVKLVADPNSILPEITYWLMGSLAKTKPESVAFTIVPMTLGLMPLLLVRWRINLLTLSDEEAKTMGVNVTLVRTVVIIGATLVTASSVSVSGMVGWVGLVIPHLTRRLVGNNYQVLMPATMLCGGIFLLLVDNVSRNLLQTEIPLGILTSIIGAPFFLRLIMRKGQLV